MNGTLPDLAAGFAVALTPLHLGFALLGALLGTAVGVLPGIGPAMTVALLLPATFGVEPTGGLILLAGIYYGAMYGGSTTSILFNVPGESATIVTAIEGHQMARAGRGGVALAMSAIGSFVAGIIGTLLIALLGPQMARLALAFGPAEQFALILLAFTVITSVLGEDRLRGIASLCVGLLLGLVGIDAQTGAARLTFAVPQLLDGLDVVLIAAAFFAVGETLFLAWQGDDAKVAVAKRGPLRMSRADWRRSWPAWLRGTAIGFPMGALPAGGAELPTLISFGIERRLTRYPEEFGHGRCTARRLSTIRPAARSPPLPTGTATGVGAAGVAVDRECHAIGPQSAAGWTLGAPGDRTPSAPARRHTGAGHGGHLRAPPIAGGSPCALCVRRVGLRDANPCLSRRPGGHRCVVGATGRAASASRSRHCGGTVDAAGCSPDCRYALRAGGADDTRVRVARVAPPRLRRAGIGGSAR